MTTLGGGDGSAWWRRAVVYQIYPRSFADHDRDGVGDVLGMIDQLPYLAALGVDAIWVSPWYPSPMADAGMTSLTIATSIPTSERWRRLIGSSPRRTI